MPDVPHDLPIDSKVQRLKKKIPRFIKSSSSYK